MTRDRPAPETDPASSLQALVDALSVSLERPVLLDDPELAPLAYSSQQGAIDSVRTSSILHRGPSAQVRAALRAQGVPDATDVVRVAAVPDLGMDARACVPVRAAGRLLGYIWLLDRDGTLADSDLEQARSAARGAAEILIGSLRRGVRDDGSVIDALRAGAPADRTAALVSLAPRGLDAQTEVILLLVAARAPADDPLTAAAAASRRVSPAALAGRVAEGAALVVRAAEPVLRALPPDGVAGWLHGLAPSDVAVGQSGVHRLERLTEASRHAATALRVARVRPSGCAAWEALGADRLVAQLPEEARRDLPAGLARLLRDEPELVRTLAAFLDAGGNVKTTAAALALHRSGLYYRLRRIEELTGLDLESGDDRLLAHLAIRTEHLS